MTNRPFPIIGFVGVKNSGKTTLIEKLLPRLSKNLKVGYLKHDAHNLSVDRDGKDTKRIFDAGAVAVIASSSLEIFSRVRGDGYDYLLMDAFYDCDIILAEGYKQSWWDKFYLNPYAGGISEIKVAGNIVGKVGNGGIPHDDIDALEKEVRGWLANSCLQKKLIGGLLIGGNSKRMGSPKSTTEYRGSAMAKTVFDLLSFVTARSYLIGNGELPEALLNKERISDIPERNGPLAGILSAHRFIPDADWLILAVDMPELSESYLRRLISKREAGFRFIGASNPDNGKIETLCAVYSSQLLGSIERVFDGGNSVQRLLAKVGVDGDASLFERKELKNVNIPSNLL